MLLKVIIFGNKKDIWIIGGKGVHKHRGMFEVNNSGQTIMPKHLRKFLRLIIKINFYKDLKLLGIRTKRSSGKKGRVTGSTRIVW